MNINQKGFVNIVLIVLVVILAGALGYVTLVKKPTPIEQPQVSNTQNTQTPRPENIQSNQQKIAVDTTNWKTFKQEIGLYQVKYPDNLRVESGAGESIGGDYFGFKNTTGGIDEVFGIAYLSVNAGEMPPKQILDEQATSLNGVKAVRQTLIDNGGNKIVRVRTTERRVGFNFIIDLHKLDYLPTFDAMLQTFNFLK